MKQLLVILVMITMATTVMAAQSLGITRASSRAPRPAPPENFTGAVTVDMLFNARDPSHASGGSVTFAPGARTAWHTHPRGQILIVTAGTGRVQLWGGPIEEIRTGDVVQIPPDQKHWHGASPRESMTHLAISEHRDGVGVQWMEQVSDDQYNSQVQSAAQPQFPNSQQNTRPSGEVQQRIAPGLAALTDDVLYGDVWARTELSQRDRSLVTIAALIATGKPAQLTGHLGRALANGVQPIEASGVLAHLAIYSGWPNAVTALAVYEQVYTSRKVDTATLRAGTRAPGPDSTPPRPDAVSADVRAVAPKFAQLTNSVVFDDLWRRSDLSARDRSLVTIAALAAMGDDEQLDFYLRRAVDSGLTRLQITEALTHVAFYAGWPRANKAMTAVARTLGRR